MKRTVLSLLAAVIALVFSTNSYAAVDMFLQIKGEKTGKVYKMRCTCPDGVSLEATFDKVAPDNYTVTVVDSKGNAVMKYDKSSPLLFKLTAREAGSGIATGKRMHKPITITKELSARSSSVSSGFTSVDCSSLDGSSSLSVCVKASSSSSGQSIEVASWSFGASNPSSR